MAIEDQNSEISLEDWLITKQQNNHFFSLFSLWSTNIEFFEQCHSFKRKNVLWRHPGLLYTAFVIVAKTIFWEIKSSKFWSPLGRILFLFSHFPDKCFNCC